MGAQTILLVIGLCVVPALFAQRSAMPVDLKETTKIDVPMTQGGLQSRGSVRDGAGNVYLRRIASEKPGQERAARPIRKISPDGNLIGSFRVLDAFQDLQAGSGVNVIGKGIFVTADGKVFQAADA